MVITSNKENLMVEPILQMSEELATVLQFLSEHASNPYYLLISPVKKLEFYWWKKEVQTNFESSSQYLDDSLLDKHYFFYKLQTLVFYIDRYRSRVSEVLPPLVIICLFALMKTARINHIELHHIMCEHEVLCEAEKQGLELINKKEEHRRLPKSLFMLEEPKQEPEKTQKGNMKISMIKSAMATAVLVLGCLSFSTA